jgi:hypothetical protein
MTTASFDTTWVRIASHQGEVFVQKRGGEFRYTVRSGCVWPDRTPRALSAGQFRRAWERMPVEGPGALQDLQGPSYLYAILTDRRITNAG